MLWIEKPYIGMLNTTLENFRWVKPDVANFRCPICGDSQKNRRKARGYIYKAPKNKPFFIFSCRNCGASMSFKRFLEIVRVDLSQQMRGDLFKAQGLNRNFFDADKIAEQSRTHITFSNPKGTKVSELDETHPARRYLESRLLPKWSLELMVYAESTLEYVLQFCESNVVDAPRIMIPVFDRKGNFVGAQGRLISGDGPRYLTFKVDGYDGPLVFGEDRVDTDRRVYIFEGAFDSMFIDNSVAVLGSGMHAEYRDCVYVYDNEPRNQQIVQKYKNTVMENKNICIWDLPSSLKDVNNMVKDGGLTPEKIKQHIDQHTFSGPQAYLEWVRWTKVK